jgi:hypothetical protein
MFKIGDKVRYIGKHSDYDKSVLKYGMIGTITNADPYHLVATFWPFVDALITSHAYRDLELVTNIPSKEKQEENLSVWDTLAE